MKFDEYYQKARILPSLIVLIPFIIFATYCEMEDFKNIVDGLFKIRIIGHLTISIALLYLLIQINRFLGKFFFEKYLFNNELELPTTAFLLFSNKEFSEDYKVRIRKNIENDFNVKMPNKQDEQENLIDTKKKIAETVGLIRQKVKKGRLLHQHNIEYGFARNFIGGSILGFLMSVFNINYFMIQSNDSVVIINIFLTIIFLLTIIFCKLIINILGKQYAKRLFQEYMQ